MVNSRKTVPFSEVLKVVSRPETLDRDKTYRILGMRWYAQGLFVREDKPGHEIQANELFRVEKDDFVYNRLFAWKGSFGIVDDNTAGGYVSGEFPCFNVFTEKADPKFIFLYLSQEPIWNEIVRISSGQTNISRLRLKVQAFLAMEIPLPPVTEQRRIVTRIEALAGRVAQAQSLRREASEEAAALVDSFARFEFNTKSYKMISVDDLVGRENLKNGKSLKSDEQPSLVSCLRISALRNGLIDCSDTKPINMTLDEAEPYQVHQDDVFIVRGNGSKDLVGRAGIIKHFDGIVIFPDLFIKVPLEKTKILPEFFVAWWNSPTMRDRIIDLAKTTSGIWKVNQGHIASCLIPLPPLEEQRRLVAYLDGLQAQVSALRARQAETEKELNALMPSILDKAFKGEL
jgi:type I restriction enzyme S subunit